MPHIVVRDAHNTQPVASEHAITFVIIGALCLVDAAIYLDDEVRFIKRADPRFTAIDQAALASKNLSNAANDVVWQAFIHEGVYTSPIPGCTNG